MNIIYCSKCGKKLLTYDDTHFKRYKPPLKKCKRCGTEYIDPRCHEIAAEGIPSDIFSIKPYVFLIIFGALIIWRGIYLLNRFQIGVSRETQWIIPTFIIICGVIGVIASIKGIISIKTGLAQKKYNRLYMESEERLRNADYVNTLRNLGYEIKEKQ